MTQTIRELMTANPLILDAKATVSEAAKQMRERDCGALLVEEGGKLCGIVTDRDIVVRCIADQRDPREEPVKDLCSPALATLEATASVDDAIEVLQARAIRRIPIIEDGTAIGIVSLGDLAAARDPESALGRISTAPATR